jgi:hypothetical protein
MELIKKWRTFISVINENLVGKSTVANRFSQHDAGRVTEATWGDSIYERIHGLPWVVVGKDLDKLDFRLLIDAKEECSKINADTAKSLYDDIVQRTTGGQQSETEGFLQMRDQKIKDLH